MIHDVRELIARTRAHPSGNGFYIGLCPAHDDDNASLWIRLATGRFGCFAGCSQRQIESSLGERNATFVQTPHRQIACEEPTQGHARRKRLERLWSEALPVQRGDPVARYLEHRGISLAAYPKALRHHPNCFYQDSKDKNFRIYLPAMLALIVDVDDVPVAIQRIYLTAGGAKAVELLPSGKHGVKKMLGPLTGGAVRLFQPTNGTIYVAEGIETALGFTAHTGNPTWSGVSANGLERLQFPDSIERVVICPDLGTPGLEAAERLARRLCKQGLSVEFMAPPAGIAEGKGIDWLDVFEAMKGRSNNE